MKTALAVVVITLFVAAIAGLVILKVFTPLTAALVGV